MTAASDGETLTGLWFDGQKYYGETLGADYEEKDLPVFDDVKRWLTVYFDGKEPDFTPPISLNTTPFRRIVWEILLTIPYGTTITYGEIADRISQQREASIIASGFPVKSSGRLSRMSAQAVGGAVGHNPVSLIIPCHRVIGKNGDLTGYAGGIQRKRKLLQLETEGRSFCPLYNGRNKPSVRNTGGRRPGVFAG